MDRSEELALLWTKAQPTVAAYISSLVPDFHQAEDILSQVAVVLVRKFDDYDRRQPFAAWAIGIARFEVLKSRRAVTTDRHVFGEHLVERITATYQEMTAELSPRRRVLEECLRQLGGRARRVLELRYVEDLKPAGVAKRLDVSAGAIRALLHRIRTMLRGCIERRLAGEGRG